MRFLSRLCIRRLWFPSLTVFTFLLFASASAIKELGGEERKMGIGWPSPSLWNLEPVLLRRRLIGPGSSPPSCRSKCGNCFPCEPVHVPIQPGRSLPLEYYPEAWRCKCGNTVFLP